GSAQDVTAPTITLTSPANADTNVLLTAAVNATFSEAIDPVTTHTPGAFTLVVATGGAAVAGNITYNSVTHIATSTPAANLAASTQFKATIAGTVMDLAGNALVAGA